MSKTQTVKHVTDYKRPWWKVARHWWPLFIFIFVAVIAALLYSNGGKYRVMSGTAERVIETIAPLESARVESISVKIGDIVSAGDVIAQLDTSIIDAEGAVLREQIQQSRLEAKLEQLTLERQFASALQEAEQALREAELEYKLSVVEHTALVEEVKRLEPLYKQQLLQAEVFLAKKAREGVLREMLALLPANIDALKSDVQRASMQKESAQNRIAEMHQNSGTDGNEDEAINLLKIRRDGYTLRANQNGVVANIERQPGDVVEPGGAIVSLLIEAPSRIVGFLPESNLSAIAVGTPANIYPTVSLNQTGVVPARVVQISPAVYSLPERVSPIRGQVVRGRRVTFELLENVSLVPGETVSIEIASSLFTDAPTEN
ncbi:MAG: HlyD family secretion protein [Opitutaceae bacterium]